MKILFVYPDICTHGGGYYTGIASLSAVLKEKGHTCKLLHIRTLPKKEEVQEFVREFMPNLIAFSCTTTQFDYAKMVAEWIKESIDAPIICGGIHPTLCPQDTIDCKYFDFVNVGEGEESLAELADAIQKNKSPNKINNVWIKTKKGIIKNPTRPLINNLDSLPYPDRTIFDFERILDYEHGFARIMASRGCPFNCTYCSNHALKNVYKGLGSYVRLRSVENVISEIKLLVKNYHIKGISFDDDTFTLFPKHLEEFCIAYKKNINLPFTISARVETVNKKILEQLKSAGCVQIAFGIESGSEWLRKNVLKRNMSNESIINAFKMAKEAGLKTYSFNMVGLPHETPKMAEETIKINKEISPDFIQASVFYPFPTTELYEICKEKGFLTNAKKTSYFDSGSTLKLNTMTQRQIKKYYNKLKAMSMKKAIHSNYPYALPVYNMADAVLAPFGICAADVFLKAKEAIFKPKK